jgi:hypothetical protein
MAEVSETGADSASEVCLFLYNLLVGPGTVEAFEWTDAEENEADLASNIESALAELELLAGSTKLFVRHPVVKNERVASRTPHRTPSRMANSMCSNISI